MTPGRKISFIYSGITIGLVLVAGVVFYVLSTHYIDDLYYTYLEEKAQMVAMERFEKDELDSVKYQNVVLRRQRAIPTSRELFINTARRDSADAALRQYLTEEQLQTIRQGETVHFRLDDEVGVALLYYDNEGTFAVLVLSRNPYGDHVGRTIGWALLLLVTLSSLVLWLISRLWAMRMVNRIDQDYQRERLFVSNASHEMNNPLTAIQGECEVSLLRERTPRQYRQSLQRIASESERLTAILHSLLHLSRPDAGQPETAPIALSAFLQRYADEHTLLLVEKDFSVAMSEEHLSMVMGNLVGNARKYSAPDGTVVIRVKGRQLTITDHGIGIPASELPHVFDPFFRAANATGRQGRGLGLPLARSLLQCYGVHIRLHSTEGEGTTVTVQF